MLVSELKLDIDKVKKRNLELINNNKWVNKLDAKQKKYLDWRKGLANGILNSDGLEGYPDISNYLLNSDKFYEININYLRDYIEIYNIRINYINISNITTDLKALLTEIQKHRIENIQKYIKIEESIFKKGIYVNDTIYRVQREPFNDNIIKNSTAWGLAPIDFFCNAPICYLYVTKIPKNIAVIYVENNSKDKNLKNFQNFNGYEFEFILPRNLKFTVKKIKKTKIINKAYHLKDDRRNFNYQTYMIYYINITKQIKDAKLPKMNSEIFKLIS